jgi:hypothetical protein
MGVQASRVFRIVWRVNAIVIFLLAIVLVGLGVTLLWQVWSAPRDRTRGPLPALRAPAHPSASRGATPLYGAVEPVPGTPFALVPIEEDRGPFHRRSRDVRDLLVYDAHAHAVRRLFPEGKRLIVRHDVLAASGDPPAVPTLLLAQVVDGDSNDDGELDADDASALLLCELGSATCTRVLEDAGTLDDDVRLRPTPALLVLRLSRASGSTLVELDLARRAVARELPLPAVP